MDQMFSTTIQHVTNKSNFAWLDIEQTNWKDLPIQNTERHTAASDLML